MLESAAQSTPTAPRLKSDIVDTASTLSSRLFVALWRACMVCDGRERYVVCAWLAGLDYERTQLWRRCPLAVLQQRPHELRAQRAMPIAGDLQSKHSRTHRAEGGVPTVLGGPWVVLSARAVGAASCGRRVGRCCVPPDTRALGATSRTAQSRAVAQPRRLRRAAPARARPLRRLRVDTRARSR